MGRKKIIRTPSEMNEKRLRQNESRRKSYHKIKNTPEFQKRRQQRSDYFKEYRKRPGILPKLVERSYKHARGIARSEANAIIEKQGGKCFICDKTPTGRRHRGRLYIDHDHKTGDIRAALCGGCNSAIGMVYENPSTLAKMIEYLNTDWLARQRPGFLPFPKPIDWPSSYSEAQ